VCDEPVLCFDGDAAGMRAAFRAVDLALPHLQAGKSLQFALLPEGQDPDDLLREAGASAVAEVIANARPLADMLWTREAEVAPLNTPERRAAFEQRLAEIVGKIPDKRVRRHYGERFRDKLAEFFGRGTGGGDRRGYDRFGGGARGQSKGRAPWQRGADRAASGASGGGASGGFSANSGPGRASSDLVRKLSGMRMALPRREAILLLALINHPDLLGERAEAVAHMELVNADLDRLRGHLLDIVAHREDEAAVDVRESLDRRGLGELVTRLEGLWTSAGRAEWWVAGDAAEVDVERAWDHTAALHHKLVTLHRELKAAEIALQAEPSDENLARLFDIQAQLSNAEGTEALMEGFGQASGRPVRAF